MTDESEGPLFPGLPLVMELSTAVDRSRVAAGGAITSVTVWSPVESRAGPPGFRCVLDDGAGQIDLLFLGRTTVPGLVVGSRCHVEGTARMDRGRLTIWNPLYRLEVTGHDRNELPGRRVYG